MSNSCRIRTLCAALGMISLAACADAPSPRARAAASDPFCAPVMARVDSFMAAAPALPSGPGYGGTAVVARVSDLLDGMNALATSDYPSSVHQQFLNLMTLVQVDEALNPVPYLAESWEFDDEGTSVTFRIRDDVYWHDGERTDANDVAFTYLRATDPETAFPNAAFWDRYVPGPDGVEVVDDFTVRFHFTPHAGVLDPWRAMAILPEHLLAEVPVGEVATHPYGSACPVGNGPFVFVSHRPQESWTFEANPVFPAGLGGPPHLRRYVFRVIPDQSTLLTELLNGTVDVFMGVRPEQAETILEDPDTELLSFDPREFTFVGWNLRRPQLADPRVRRALTMATDRQALVDALLQGYGIVAETGVPPFHWAYEPELDAPTYDPAGARALLDRIGWRDRDGDGVRENGDGVALSVSILFNPAYQDRRAIVELMQAQLAEIGVEVTPEPAEAGEFARRVTNPEDRDFDGLVLTWVSEFRVDEKDLFHSARGQGPLAFAGLNDRRMDQLMDTLQLVTDRADARELWLEYQRRVVELQPFTYLYYARKLTGLSRRLEGVEMDFRGELLNVGEWRLVEAGSD